MHNRERLYDAGMHLARPLAGALAPLHPKGAAAMQGRRDSAGVLAEWSAKQRDDTRPLVLVHAPSVGEALMAQAIISEIRLLCGNAQVAFTFFSPSAERVAARVGADVTTYLPFDTRSDMRRLLDTLRPSVIAFVRTEIWPMLGLEAKSRGVRVAFVNAVLGAQSSRLRPAARYVLGPAYRRLDAVGAVAADDAARFATLGVSPDHTFITGDARFDQVWKRVQSLDLQSTLLTHVRDGRDIIVAGSTWPDDEVMLMHAIEADQRHARNADGARDVRGARYIIAPHEPTVAHMRALESRIDAIGASHERLSQVTNAGHSNADVIVVDTIGVLADLYAAATIAYVGGGFGDSGLHSVVEPAALGVPVIYGPRHGNAREAGDLAAAGGGVTVNNAGELTVAMRRLRADATTRTLAGTAALTFVRSRLGGAAANASLICGLMTLP